jgi:hypothetical protein
VRECGVERRGKATAVFVSILFESKQNKKIQ